MRDVGRFQPGRQSDSPNRMLVHVMVWTFALLIIRDASQDGMLGLGQRRHGELLPSFLAGSWGEKLFCTVTGVPCTRGGARYNSSIPVVLWIWARALPEQ